MGACRLEIWNRANDTKLSEAWTLDADLHQRNIDDLNPTGHKIDGTGSGGFAIQLDHPAVLAGHVKPGNVVRVHSDTTLVYSYRLKDRDRTTITRKQSDKVVKLNGDDLADDWAKAVVEPWIKGDNARPVSLDRLWNWSMVSTDDWDPVVSISRTAAQQKLPVAWPVAPTFGGYIWSRALSSGTHPVGAVPFARDLVLEDDSTIVLYGSADNAIDALYMDGVLIASEVAIYPSQDGFRKTHRWAFKASAGTHKLRAKVTNWQGSAVNPAGLIAAGFYVNSDGSLGDIIFTSESSSSAWKCLDHPSVLPGFTPVEILAMLLDEAQTRDELLGWSIETHGTFDQMPEFSCRVGTTYRDVLASLQSTVIDFRADLEGLKLHVWPKGEMGSTLSIEITEDQVTNLSIKDDDEFWNVVEGIWAEGVMWREDAASITALGERRSKPLSLGSVKTEESVTQILDAFLDANSMPSESIVGELIDVPGVTAGVDYRDGDRLPLLGSEVQCVGLTWTVDRQGKLVPHPEWETVSGVRRRTLTLAVERMISSYDAPATASLLGNDPLVFSGIPGVEDFGWSWSGSIADWEDPDEPLQPQKPEERRRLYRFTVSTKPEDLPDAWGETIIELWKNGALLNGLYNLSLTTTVASVEVPIWAYETINPDDRIEIRFSQDGGHVEGNVKLGMADQV